MEDNKDNYPERDLELISKKTCNSLQVRAGLAFHGLVESSAELLLIA
jgi:hypothetical protein